MSSPNKDRAIFSRVKFLPSIDLAVKKLMEAKKSKIKWKPQTKTDLEQEGHPLLSSLSLREYCAGHCHCNCQSAIVIVILTLIANPNLHPAQMAWPSTHCQILIGGFISLDINHIWSFSGNWNTSSRAFSK